MKRLRAVLLAGFSIVAMITFAQSLTNTPIGVFEGLSQGSVYTMLKDSKGFLWMGTEDGISRYDGSRFYKPGSGSIFTGSLRGSVVMGMIEYHQQLYVGTESGIHLIDIENYHITPLPIRNWKSQNTIPVCIRGHCLYALTSTQGLIAIDLQTHGYVVADAAFPFTYSYFGIANFIVKDDGILFAVGNQLLQENLLTKTQKEYQHFADPIEFICAKDPNSLFVIGAKKIYCLASNHTVSDSFPLPDSIRCTYACYSPTTQRLLIGTDLYGCYSYDITKKKLQPLAIENNKGLVFNIYESDPGICWINFNPQGLRKVEFKEEFLKKMTAETIKGLPDYTIRSFAEMPDGRLWLGTQNGGIYEMDDKLQTLYKIYNQSSTHSAIAADRILVMKPDSHQHIWIATTAGASMYDLTHKQFFSIPFYDVQKRRLKSMPVSTFFLLENGWCCSTESGIFQYQESNQGFHQMPDFGNESFEQFIQIAADEILLSSTTTGVQLYRKKNGRWQLKKTFLEDYFTLSFATHPSPPHQILICTNKGIALFDKKIHHLTPPAPNSDNIYAAIFDTQHRQWMSTNGGIVMQDAGENKTIAFTEKKELQSLEFNVNAYLLSSRGMVYFGGTQGANYFNPENFTLNKQVPQPYIISLQNNDSFYTIGESSIALDFTHHTFTLQFSSIDYLSNGKNFYQYRLKGIDRDWIAIGNETSVHFAQLPIGTYTFQVKAANSHQIWNETPAELQITILPPFYQTKWFYTLCTFATLLLLYSIYRYQLAQKLKEYKMRDTIAADLHDDIGATLTNISLLSQVVKRKMDTQEASYQQLDDIHQSSRDAIENMSDIVWSVNPQNDSFQFLMDKIENFGEGLFDPQQIIFTLSFPPDITSFKTSMVFRKNSYLMIKEALNNSSKYAYATEVTVTFLIEKNRLVVVIKDNGVGFDSSQHTTGNGLRNMRKRAEEMDGIFQLESYTEKGTCITTQIQLKNI